MIDPENKLSIHKQSTLLKVSRSSVYYKPRPLSEDCGGSGCSDSFSGS
jgi:hypothetical protein